jgi:diaminopropionate ammonia-lyase
MKTSSISLRKNLLASTPDPQLFDFASTDTAAKVLEFHRSLPRYHPTPLVNLAELAHRLGIRKLLVKDESQRFDLNAFKVLGASYAIAKYLGELLELPEGSLGFDAIHAQQEQYRHTTFVTATDGNHGRAVAWAASLLGCKSVVYMPKGSSQARLEAIQNSGADAAITDLNYDDTVIFARQQSEQHNWLLLQDTSWPGYEKVPLDIMRGYLTLITEYREQAHDIWPTHVFVQAGVGSLAAAILAGLHCTEDRPTPAFITVEPLGAPCLYESAQQSDGKPYRVQGDLPTIMAGLACGEPSHMGWEILKSASSAFLVCTDDIARRGMKILGNPLCGDQRIISGESGGVTAGALYEIMTNEHYRAIREELALSGNSTVLLFSTEGDTDPEAYRDIVW